MQFSDSSNLTGLIQSCEDKINSSITGDLLKKFTRYINNASSKVWAIIFDTYNGWIYDDANQTDLPQATSDLVSGTSTYSLPSTALTVQRIEIKDSEGNFIPLKSLTLEEIQQGVDEFYENNGTPQGYRLLGNTIEIFPASSYNSTSGLKVYFERASVAFASTDTTKTAGFASPFHDMLAIDASIQYMSTKNFNQNQINNLKLEYEQYKIDLKNFYGKRFRDYKPRLKAKKTNWE